MGSSTIYVGLEIGTSKVCVVVGEVRSDGAIKILGIGQHASAGVRKGEIVDPTMVQTCLQDALARAEDRASVNIGNVVLSLTGGHIAGFNSRGSIRVADDQVEISYEDLEEVRKNACDVPLPQDHVLIHSLIQSYYLDGNSRIPNPVGMLGQKLEADFHLIHGVKSRIQNSIRCISDEVHVDEIVFAPYAAACALLNRDLKMGGVLLIDIGGGTSDYICYVDGSPVASGCVPIGGEHITSDIAHVLKITNARAEKLKITYGSVTPWQGADEIVSSGGDINKEVSRSMLNQIINARAVEMLSVVQKRIEDAGCMQKIGRGVVLTGGSSLMNGLYELTEKIFGLPVQKADSESMSGPAAFFENPQCATPIGIIRYIQMIDAQKPKKGILRRLGSKIEKILGSGR